MLSLPCVKRVVPATVPDGNILNAGSTWRRRTTLQLLHTLLLGNACLAHDLMKSCDVGAELGVELRRCRGNRLIAHGLDAGLRVGQCDRGRRFALDAHDD